MNNEFQHSEKKKGKKKNKDKRSNRPEQTSDSAARRIRRQEEEKRRKEEEENKNKFQTKLTQIMDSDYALHYKRLAQIYNNFGEFKNLFLGIGKTREDVENILLAAKPLLVTATVDEQPKQPWEDWADGELQLSNDGDMVSVKDSVYIRVGNRYEPFNKSTATLYTQDGCLSGSWSLAAKNDEGYKYVSHTDAMKNQMKRQVFYTGQELEDVKQKLKTRYRDAIRMRFVDEFLSNKDRLFKYRCKELFKSNPDNETYKHYDLVDYEQIDPLYNRNLVAEKSNMLRAKEAIVRVEFNCCNNVDTYNDTQKEEEKEREEDEQRRQRVEEREDEQKREKLEEQKRKEEKKSKYKREKADNRLQKIRDEQEALQKALEVDLLNEKEIEFKPTESMFASDSESEAKEQESEGESEAFVEAPKEIDLQESDVESEAFEEESKTVEEETKEVEAPKEIDLQESEEESEAFVEAPKELERVDSPMSDDDLMRLMKDDRVLDMLDGLSDSESVREMSMSESDQEVREVKVSVDSDSDKEFSFAATSEDDTLTSMMQNMDAFASDEDDEDEVKWASTSSGAD